MREWFVRALEVGVLAELDRQGVDGVHGDDTGPVGVPLDLAPNQEALLVQLASQIQLENTWVRRWRRRRRPRKSSF